MGYLDGKTVLVTGGTGSFGNAFVELALREHNPRAIRVYSRDELKQLQMRERFGEERVRYLIGDVRDHARLMRALYDVDIVVHAAALKQVPTAERDPIEAVKTNIDGTVAVIDAAIERGVSRLMFLSTDKSVRPANLYGATKMVAEKLCVNANRYSAGRTLISCVRYGNVIGSRGSVVPLFVEQRKRGYLTITDETMSRFWITLEQGVRFVISSIENMAGGEIYVPKLPSMRLKEMADAIAPRAERRKIPVRSGEKRHESLISPEESRNAREFDAYYRIDAFVPLGAHENERGRPVAEGFEYRSDTNDAWLSTADLRRMLIESGFEI